MEFPRLKYSTPYTGEGGTFRSESVTFNLTYRSPSITLPIFSVSKTGHCQTRRNLDPESGSFYSLFSLFLERPFQASQAQFLCRKSLTGKSTKIYSLLGVDVSTMCKSQTVKKTNKDGKPRRKYQRRAEKPLIPRPKRALTAFNIYTGKDESREPWQEGVIRRLLLFFDQSTSA